MTEANRITAELLIEIPKRWPHIRCWRTNSGAGVGMEQVHQAISAIQAGNPVAAVQFLQRPLKFGLVGAADISLVIGPHGRFGQIEVKAGKDKMREQQNNWRETCAMLGVPYIVARSTVQGIADLERFVGK